MLLYGAYFQNKYVLSLLIIIVSIGAALLLLFIFNKFLMKFAAKTKTKLDDIIFNRIKKPLFYLILTSGLRLVVEHLELNNIFKNSVNTLMVGVLTFIIVRVLDIIIETWGQTFSKKTKTTLDDVLLPLFHKISRIVLVLFGFLWVLRVWEVNITPYLAGVGIGGIVLGLALQDSLKNMFGGISLLLDKSFKVGDPIKLESGELGIVKDIGLRSTKMLTYDNEMLFIPNGQLANMRFRNYVKPNTRVRKVVEFSVAYGTDPTRVKKIVLPALKKIKDIYDDPYMDIIFTSMGDSGIHFQARFWVDWDNAYNKWLEATEEIYGALQKAGIEIPFPTRTIYLKK